MAAGGNWENCVRSQGAYLEGDQGVIVLCTVFLVSCISIHVSMFLATWLDTFWTDRIIWTVLCAMLSTQLITTHGGCFTVFH